MVVSEMAKNLGLTLCCGEGGLNRGVSGCYIGDLLSLAMSKVQKDNVWITIQTNINIAAVAALAEAACIICCDGFKPDENTQKKANLEGIPIYTSEDSAYNLARMLVENGV